MTVKAVPVIVGSVCLTLGLLIGSTLFGSSSAEAQEATGAQMRECAVTRVSITPKGYFPSEKDADILKVPSGWVPVGGGSQGETDMGIVVLCRP
jgi:hypothetical protein